MQKIIEKVINNIISKVKKPKNTLGNKFFIETFDYYSSKDFRRDLAKQIADDIRRLIIPREIK